MRVPTAGQANAAKRRAYVPFLGDAFPSVTVEAALRAEWEAHAVTADPARLDRAVKAARAAGVSWSGIGAATGISRQ
jgi:hypothetical protein